MGFVSRLGRLLLIVFNMLFLIVSLGLITLGLLIRFYPGLATPDVVLDALESKVKTAFPDQQNTFNTDDFAIGELFEGLSLSFIIVGFIMLAFCFFGCCGACYRVKFMLITYAVVVSVLLVAEVVFVALTFSKPDTVKDRMKAELQPTLSKYQGMNGTNVQSLAWNFIMIKFECCGVVNYEDFADADDWWAQNEAVTPWACCLPLPENVGEAMSCTNHNNKHQGTTDLAGINSFDTGCVDAIWEWFMEDNKLSLMLGVYFGFFLQLLLIIFAAILYTQPDDGKVAPQDQRQGQAARHDRRDKPW